LSNNNNNQIAQPSQRNHFETDQLVGLLIAAARLLIRNS